MKSQELQCIQQLRQWIRKGKQYIINIMIKEEYQLGGIGYEIKCTRTR